MNPGVWGLAWKSYNWIKSKEPCIFRLGHLWNFVGKALSWTLLRNVLPPSALVKRIWFVKFFSRLFYLAGHDFWQFWVLSRTLWCFPCAIVMCFFCWSSGSLLAFVTKTLEQNTQNCLDSMQCIIFPPLTVGAHVEVERPYIKTYKSTLD